jgi:hypothetical protein
MSGHRVKTGFHRAGMLLAALCGLPAVWALASWYKGYPDSLVGLTASLIAAAILYGLARAVGWIIAGFAGDGDDRK